MESRHGAEGAGLFIVEHIPFGHSGTPPGVGNCSQGSRILVMPRYDVIVVGAGPAGSTTAYRLARAGARVCLLDRARFPRDKPCGGGLTLRAVRELPFSVDPVVEDRVDTLELGLRYGRRWSRRADEPLVLMTQRRRLDAFLADQAAGAGVEFRDSAKVTGIDPGGALTLAGERLDADVIVGADGANGITARSLGLPAHEHGVALEGNVSYAHVSRQRFGGRAVVELGAVPGGYAWVFPKGDHVNVGVGGWRSEGPRLRERLRELCAAFEIDEAEVRDLRGHRLPMRGASRRPVEQRVLLVGDAAGLVDPLSGDGMYEAFISGRLAAEAALDLLAGRTESLEPYAEQFAATFAPLESVSWRAKLAFERFPALAFRLATTRLSWRLFQAVVRGDRRASDTHGLRGAPLRVLQALGA
jgi:geranylgeranyl reductase family protein